VGNFFGTNGPARTSLVDTWTTPKHIFDKLNEEFNFGLDAAALESSALCKNWYGPDHPDPNKRDAIFCDWNKDSEGKPIFLNPPYGRTMKPFLIKADQVARGGA